MLDFQSSALPIELPSRLTREKMRKNNHLHNYGTMTTPVMKFQVVLLALQVLPPIIEEIIIVIPE